MSIFKKGSIEQTVPTTKPVLVPPLSDNFDFAVKYVLENEGGYSNDPNDPGGATNFGITIDDLRRFRGTSVTPSDVKNMAVSEAYSIYKKFYWLPMSCDQMQTKAIVTCVFDSGVLYGITTSAKYAQRVGGLSSDGVIGPLTLKYLNSADPKAFVTGFRGLIVDHINSLINANGHLEAFRNGWMNRANRLLTLI